MTGKRETAPYRRVTRDVTSCTHSRFNEPTLTVSPGETFVAETELCTGDWLKSIDDRWEPGIGFGPNPAVVVGVDGARPGDVLTVRIEHIQPDALGYTGFGPGMTPFPDWIRNAEWGVADGVGVFELNSSNIVGGDIAVIVSVGQVVVNSPEAFDVDALDGGGWLSVAEGRWCVDLRIRIGQADRTGDDTSV